MRTQEKTALATSGRGDLGPCRSDNCSGTSSEPSAPGTAGTQGGKGRKKSPPPSPPPPRPFLLSLKHARGTRAKSTSLPFPAREARPTEFVSEPLRFSRDVRRGPARDPGAQGIGAADRPTPPSRRPSLEAAHKERARVTPGPGRGGGGGGGNHTRCPVKLPRLRGPSIADTGACPYRRRTLGPVPAYSSPTAGS